jgi:predicted transposase YbfD/YdcC
MKIFLDCFSELPDPRAPNTLHELSELLFIALLASLSGATSCVDMAFFARSKADLLAPVLTLRHGFPSHDTFARIFRMLDPTAFEACFQRFMAAFAKGAGLAPVQGVVAIDGKALRRGYEAGRSHMPPVMVTAWAAETRMALANIQASGRNEALSAMQLIEMIQLKGCVVTADALHCHRAMAATIVGRGGDYVLAVKGSQPTLLREARQALAGARPQARTMDKAHGRQERRSACVASVPGMAKRHDFPGLKAVAMITAQRDKTKPTTRFFLMSQPYTARQVLAIVRQHWGIENRLHWPLDVLLDEDLARNRKDNAPANLATLKRLALNVARAKPEKGISLRLKLKRAGWSDAHLFEMISHMR